MLAALTSVTCKINIFFAMFSLKEFCMDYSIYKRRNRDSYCREMVMVRMWKETTKYTVMNQ